MTDASPAANPNVVTAVAPSRLPFATRMSVQAIVITVSLAALVANVFRTDPLRSANDRSRWCTVESLLSGEGYVIDEIDRDPSWTTIDKVRHEGHFYSTKPPLLPTLVAGITWCVEAVSGLDLRDDVHDVVPWVLVFVNVIPLAVALLVVVWLTERFATTDFTAVFVVVVAGMATLLLPFSASLNNHTIAACAVFVTLAAVTRILGSDDDPRWAFAVCGFFAGFACVNELPAAAFGVAVFVLLHLRNPLRTWAIFVPAALVPLAAHLGLNYAVTGGLKPFYAYYGTEKYVFVHEGVPSYWSRPTGIDDSHESPLVYFFHCTLGHHGLLSLTPVYVLTLLGWWTVLRRSQTSKPKAEPLTIVCGLGLVLTGIVLAFYLSRTQNYNYGGNSAGLRWTIWLIPFWLLAMIPALDRLTSLGGRGLALGLLAVSTFSAWSSATTPWEPPWLYDVMERAGWIDYEEPRPTLDRPLRTLIGSLPGLDDEGQPRWIEFQTMSEDGREMRVRLTDQGTDGGTVHYVMVDSILGGLDRRVGVFGVDPDRLRADGDWLVVDDRSEGSLGAWLMFVRGLPEAADFEAKAIRYVRTPLRSDAFECEYAIARVTLGQNEDESARHCYCETLLNDEVPFGVVEYTTTVTDAATGAILVKRRWTAVDASDYPAESPLVVEPSR